MSFKIVVDSCCDLTPDMLSTGDFISVPLTIHVGGASIVDDHTFDQADLLRRMRECPDSPKTSCPSLTQYMDAYSCGADDIYVVTLSALLSGSHNSAQQARQLWLEENNANIHVFNSCSASAGEVRIALKIRELAASGMPFQQVVEQTSRFIASMETLFVLESLDNLRKNGRLNRLESIITGTLKIKLFMGATPEGEICKLGQAISIKQALKKMLTRMAEDPAHEDKLLCISHCNCPERAQAFRESVLRSCRFSEIVICDTAGISSVYAYDGGLVVAY